MLTNQQRKPHTTRTVFWLRKYKPFPVSSSFELLLSIHNPTSIEYSISKNTLFIIVFQKTILFLALCAQTVHSYILFNGHMRANFYYAFAKYNLKNYFCKTNILSTLSHSESMVVYKSILK